MARLEYIHYEFRHVSLGEDGDLVYTKEARPPIKDLPQIYWEDGTGWDEANVWALDRAASGTLDAETIKRTMKHLCRYANFLEAQCIDWRNFPIRKEERVLNKFKGRLEKDRDKGLLESSTAMNCMNSVIQFYRFADTHNLVGSEAPMWEDRIVRMTRYDNVGFKRAMSILSTDLSIKNSKRQGVMLEDGLLPLSAEHWNSLLAYTAVHAVEELHRMLAIGFFTGARLGTITTLTVTSLETARAHPTVEGLYLLPVGPGTDVATKSSVNGNLHIPEAVLMDLKAYATSTTRLLREKNAHPSHKDVLFLTRTSKPYTVATVDRLVHTMRSQAADAGLHFMHKFKFHQSRATFGTWLMQLLLDCGATTSAIEFVRDAMLHKSESMTWRYIKFLENTPAKEKAAGAFSAAFTNVTNRNWEKVDA
ncbi:site-specific integrase [Cupriavidus neocaledonicus]|uniref:Phage integrase family protein n=1 Tax=Cupriavidus neocaledonicus TaxID=1040979 RepID=A0ABY1V1M5_9BURK|nr:site-specific integrase [Cupriavidus neocaledonicus]SOZ36192.1 Phage integrase family protein [Cupriavidus neocaledonicus]